MRGVAVVAILTLALGIGATTTMFSVVYATLLRPPPFADPERLVILFNTSVTPREGLRAAPLVDAQRRSRCERQRRRSRPSRRSRARCCR